MEIEFSRHAAEKLDDPTSKRLEITAKVIKTIIDKPEVIDNSDYPVLLAVGELRRNLALCIVYKFIEKKLRVITFFPARKGRYESKILSRR